MGAENLLLLLLSIAIFVYLVYALFRGERL
ncbi:MAG TPA: potassium-transporting ATPase subunit F [Gaiellaceae bacterium]|jgi:K+-transporting ATPase KdpF subunit